MARIRISLLALISTVVLSGCGSDDGLGRRYAVSGTITYKGQPLEKGSINFYPVTPDPKGVNNGANSAIVGGKYQLSTRGDSDGAFEGEYVVAIESKDVDMTAAKSRVKAGSFKQDDVSKAYRKAKSLIPLKYSIAETSGFKATVAARSNTINFDLVD